MSCRIYVSRAEETSPPPLSARAHTPTPTNHESTQLRTIELQKEGTKTQCSTCNDEGTLLLRIELHKNFIKVVLIPVDFWAKPREFPDAIDFAVPVFDVGVAMTPILNCDPV